MPTTVIFLLIEILLPAAGRVALPLYSDESTLHHSRILRKRKGVCGKKRGVHPEKRPRKRKPPHGSPCGVRGCGNDGVGANRFTKPTGSAGYTRCRFWSSKIPPGCLHTSGRSTPPCPSPGLLPAGG